VQRAGAAAQQGTAYAGSADGFVMLPRPPRCCFHFFAPCRSTDADTARSLISKRAIPLFVHAALHAAQRLPAADIFPMLFCLAAGFQPDRPFFELPVHAIAFAFPCAVRLPR